MTVPYVHVVRAQDKLFRSCGFRGCTSFASHVLCAGERALCFVCAQCAAVGATAHAKASGKWWAFKNFRTGRTA